jgi:hypothetical protein
VAAAAGFPDRGWTSFGDTDELAARGGAPRLCPGGLLLVELGVARLVGAGVLGVVGTVVVLVDDGVALASADRPAVDRHGHHERDRKGDREADPEQPAGQTGWRTQPSEASSSVQARSQRRHASAQTRQCSCISACRSHSSAQEAHVCRHAWSTARVRLAS